MMQSSRESALYIHQMHQLSARPASDPLPGNTCRSAKAVCHRAAFSHAWLVTSDYALGGKMQQFGQVILTVKKLSTIASYKIW